MTDEIPERAERTFERHDAFERDDGAFNVTTTKFGGRVTAEGTDDWAIEYTLTVRAPMLSAAVAGEAVGDAVEDGWFDTYGRRLEDAPKATRLDVELDDLTLRRDDGEAVAVFTFTHGNADQAPVLAKTFAEYLEGTYVEGIVPGYEYEGVVGDLIGDARSQGGSGGGNSMPM
ncbi:DUF5813 family protein [Halorientalis marina]|uniref:DUF5813 family protein n=1 Tax=Halorientalis marina TaxID=2931976 RepID=UPI001FF446E4|nr:DUF5813 family protein [Halorientalis marina]